MVDIIIGNNLIRVQKTNFKGKDYIDIRKFYQDENEEWKPTRKGVTVPIDFAEKVSQAIKDCLSIKE